MIMSDFETVGNCFSSYREYLPDLLEKSMMTAYFHSYTENVLICACLISVDRINGCELSKEFKFPK